VNDDIPVLMKYSVCRLLFINRTNFLILLLALEVLD
jgi:hypothetical protein